MPAPSSSYLQRDHLHEDGEVGEVRAAADRVAEVPLRAGTALARPDASAGAVGTVAWSAEAALLPHQGSRAAALSTQARGLGACPALPAPRECKAQSTQAGSQGQAPGWGRWAAEATGTTGLSRDQRVGRCHTVLLHPAQGRMGVHSPPSRLIDG